MAFVITGRDKYGKMYYCKSTGRSGSTDGTFDSFLTSKFATKQEAERVLRQNRDKFSKKFPDVKGLTVEPL